MKIPRLFLLLLALPTLSGCEPSPCFASGVSAPPIQPGMILVGEQTRLILPPNIQVTCEAVQATPTSLTVEVYDPDNQPVEHESSLSATSSGVATIRFTPLKAGRHHVFVAFDPVGGIQQFDLFAAMDRSADTTALTLNQACEDLERTRQGAWVCGQELTRDGASVMRFTNSRLAVVGDVVWVVDGTKVQRYVDTGTTLALTASLNHQQGAAEFLQASENELVVLHASVIQRFTFSGTALSSTGTSQWIQPLTPITSPGPRALLLREGDRLGLVTRNSTTPGGLPTHQVCPYRLESGRFVRTSDTCVTVSGSVVGYEQNALWLGDPQPFSEQNLTGLRYAEWTGTRMVEQASLPLSFTLKMSIHPLSTRLSVVPNISSPTSALNSRPRSAVAVYSAERRAILLEYLDPELIDPRASSRLAWSSTSSSSSTLVRLRPAAP